VLNSLTPASPIKLSDTKLKLLARSVQDLITDLESQSQPLFKAMRVWQKNYEAQPRQAQKDFPFRNASNIVVPLAKMMVDSRVASLWEAIHGAGSQVWTARTQNENEEDRAKAVVRYINWQADGNDFDFGPATYDWIQEFTSLGSSVLAGVWRDQKSFIHQTQFTASGNRGVPKPVEISWSRGPALEPVPRHQILWDTSYESIAEAPAVVRQFALTWGQLTAQAAGSAGWITQNIEDSRLHTGLVGPGEEIQNTQDELDSRGPKSQTFYEPHDIREVTLSWAHLAALDINGSDLQLLDNKKVDTSTVDIVVVIHRRTGKILRLTSQPYFWPGKPFFAGYFHKRVGRGHSVGMVKVVEQLQAAMTTILNQGIDAQTRANAIWGKTNMHNLLSKPIDFQWIFDPTMKGVEALNFPGSDFSNIQLLQTIQAMAERLTGQSDPALGRETRLGGHSAPATTTLALLERGNTLAAPDRGLLVRELSRAGEFVATLDQQFEADADGKINRVLGPIDGELVSEVLFPTEPIPMHYRFSVRGLSRSDNPETEMKRQLTVDQQNQNYWGKVFSITETAAQNMQAAPPAWQPILLEAYTQGLKSITKTYKRFLDAVEIDDTENFILSVNEPGSPIAELLETFGGRAGEAAGTVQPGEPPGPVAAPGVVPSNGAAGPPGVTPQ
jgi:hypothetical protein